MHLFTPADRAEALSRLLSIAAESSSILGTLLVGSGSVGFNDELSDLDVVVVVESDGYSQVFAETTSHAHMVLQPVFSTTYQHRVDVHVVCLLLRNYLEIDLGIWSVANLFASSPRWNVVQQRDDLAGQRIIAAMTTNSPLVREQDAIVSGDDPLWQAIYGGFVADRRSRQGATDVIEHRNSLFHGNSARQMLRARYRDDQVEVLLPLVPEQLR